jgi:hypothetical protein
MKTVTGSVIEVAGCKATISTHGDLREFTDQAWRKELAKRRCVWCWMAPDASQAGVTDVGYTLARLPRFQN